MKNVFLLATTAVLLWTCASQTTPDGGPKDELPPVLLNSIPKNNGLNFRGKAILLEFSEPIKLNNPKEQIIIVPNTGKKTVFKIVKNSLVIEPELPWLENTTYSIQLREGVQDITEGNAARNVYIAFSTGDVIDSLSISGTVSEVFSEKAPEDMTVALYTSDTFDIQRHTPYYFAKADKNGRYKLQNLKADTYFIYAFQDKNKNLKAETKTEKTGFLVEPIQLQKDTAKVNIQVVTVDARPLKVISIRKNGLVNQIRFNKMIDHYTLRGHTYFQSFGDNQSEVTVYFPDFFTDSTKVSITAVDSVHNKIDTTLWLATLNKDLEEPFKLTINQATLTAETSSLEITGSYTKPIQHINFDSIYIRLDSTNRLPLPPAGLKLDSSYKRFTYRATLPLADSTELDTKWQLVFAKGSLRSVSNDSLKAVTKALTFVDEESTGILNFDQILSREKSYLIQFLDSQGKIVRQFTSPTKLSVNYLPPESFKIRAVIDSNKNGKWDAGNIYQRRDHERTIYFKTTEGKFETPVRANWEVGPFKFVF
jgi:uncharacterized protein (DUF2141 family)